MSARRVIRRNVKAVKNNIINSAISQYKIRTFQQQDSYKLLSEPSEYLLAASKNNKQLKEDLLKLRGFAASQKLVYLTDIQAQSFFNVFVIHKNPLQNKWLDESYKNPLQFDLYVNSKITKNIGQIKQVEQFCHSFPFIKSIVDRYQKIQINYAKITNFEDNSNQINIENITEELSGFKSYVFQHCMDHIYGKHFFTPEISKGRISMQFDDKLFDKTRYLIRQYNIRIKKALQENKTGSVQFLKTKKDYQQRIRKQFIEEFKVADEENKKFPKIF